jgi:hypothetical protein
MSFAGLSIGSYFALVANQIHYMYITTYFYDKGGLFLIPSIMSPIVASIILYQGVLTFKWRAGFGVVIILSILSTVLMEITILIIYLIRLQGNTVRILMLSGLIALILTGGIVWIIRKLPIIHTTIKSPIIVFSSAAIVVAAMFRTIDGGHQIWWYEVHYVTGLLLALFGLISISLYLLTGFIVMMIRRHTNRVALYIVRGFGILQIIALEALIWFWIFPVKPIAGG